MSSAMERAVLSLADQVSLQGKQMERMREAIESSNQKTSESLQALSHTVEVMDQQVSNHIDRLTVQVGSFASSVVELKSLSRELLAAIGRQTEAINGHLSVADRQAAVAQQQAETVAELSRLAQQILSRAS